MSPSSLHGLMWIGVMAALVPPARAPALWAVWAATILSVTAAVAVEIGSLETGRGSSARRPLQALSLLLFLAHLIGAGLGHFLTRA